MIRTRIGIVNDLRLAQQALSMIVARNPHLEVCWTALDGMEAVECCARDLPDLILMDLLMPRLNGAEATRVIMQSTPCPILVVTATVQGNLGLVYEAMGHGALDAVVTPTLGTPEGPAQADALLAKIDAVLSLARGSHLHAAGHRTRPASTPARAAPGVLAIGSSTGGPAAIECVLRDLPADFPAPIVIAQHMDQEFIQGFVDWLGTRVDLEVALAAKDDPLIPGRVLISASSAHLALASGNRVTYVDGPPGALFRPSVDILFESAARHAPPGSIGVLLTGLGRDGASGLLAMRNAGLHTIAQDQATSVVWGMPGTAVALGAAQQILPLQEICGQIVNLNRIENK